jgi:Mce-associated membrane protein
MRRMTTTGIPTLPPPGGPPETFAVDPGLGDVPASWSRRVIAFLLDWAVLAFGTFLVLGDVGSFTPVPFFTTEGLDPAPRVGSWPWWGAFALIASLVLLQAYTGSTPGKAAVAIVVVDDKTGRPIGLLRTVARWIAHFVDAILCIGYLRPLWHPERRTFADSWQGTLVVHRPAERPTPVSLAATTVCLVAVAASLTQGSGSTTLASSALDCGSSLDGGPRGMVSRERVTSWVSRLGIRRDVPSEPQPVNVELEGLPSGTERLLVTTAPFGSLGGDLRDADQEQTWSVNIAQYPEVEIERADDPEVIYSTNAASLEASTYGATLADPWAVTITPSEVHELGPGISIQIVMVDADGGEELFCAGSIDDA